MTYCFHPNCQQPYNSDQTNVCQNCAASLLLNSRYRAVRLLGQGNFGRTFLTVDERSAEPQLCVIKQFLPRASNAGEQQVAMVSFQQEAKRLAELGKHPQIPDLLDFFQEGDQFYLVQEYISGSTLEQVLLEQGSFSEPQIWQVLEGLLPVLQFIHDRQVIHRDIKPANIIDRSPSHQGDGKFVLVDFGAAKVVTPTDWKTGTVIGSAEYVAPEQARGKAVFASDLYSLGVTCIHLLTGLSPFELMDSVNNTWVWQQFLSQSVSAELSQILDHLIHPALNQRFQSAEAVLQTMPNRGEGPQKYEHRESLEPLPPLSCSCSKVLIGHRAAINGVAIGGRGQTLASGGHDKTVRLWDRETGQEIHQLLNTAIVWSVTFDSEGELLAAGLQDKTIQVWEVASLQRRFTFDGHTQPVKTVTFHPNLPYLASGSGDKTIRFWDIRSGQEVAVLSNHRLQVNTLSFSPDGQWFASGSNDRTVCLWRLHTSEQGLSVQYQRTLTDHVGNVLAVAFSPDSQTLVSSGDDRTIKVWNVNTGQLLQTLSGHSWTVSSLGFIPAPSGQSSDIKSFLVSGSWDALLKLWPVTKSSILPSALNLVGHTDAIHSVALCPADDSSGFSIISGSRDQTLRIWQCQ